MCSRLDEGMSSREKSARSEGSGRVTVDFASVNQGLERRSDVLLPGPAEQIAVGLLDGLNGDQASTFTNH